MLCFCLLCLLLIASISIRISSDIQVDLKYARWAELKHGRICMLAIVGMLVQQAGIHIPGDQFTNTDIFGAISSVGFAGNIQVFLAIGAVEVANFSKYYGEGTPGDIGLDGGMMGKMSEAQKFTRMTSEVVHCRLAMIAFTGGIVQTLLFNKPLLEML
jgi:light-harvesting complex I chlorophyll a/b binding protein 1